MSEHIAVAFEILDHGIDHAQCFQGCGVSFTDFGVCFTGIGDNPAEALDDALEQAAPAGWNVDIVNEKLPETPSVADIREQEEAEERERRLAAWVEEGNDPDDFDGDGDDDNGNGDERNYYVSVRLREYHPELDGPEIKTLAHAIGRLHDLWVLVHNLESKIKTAKNGRARKTFERRLHTHRKEMAKHTARVKQIDPEIAAALPATDAYQR